jgi:hypothetical protein
MDSTLMTRGSSITKTISQRLRKTSGQLVEQIERRR